MSRSNPSEDVNLVNPAKFFLEWKGKEGGFEYWDKVKKENVDKKLPFTFIPLCTCITLKGYNQKKEIGFWSNEVKDITKDKFVVKGKGKNGSVDTYFEGFYKDLKEKLELNKINYVQSVYIAYKDDKGALALANIQIKTSALGPWITFCKANNINECAVTVKKFTKEKNGDVEFVAPVYEAVKISEASNKEAVELDVKLQEYLKAYLEKNNTASAEVKEDKPEVKAESKSAESSPKPQSNTEFIEEMNSSIVEDDDEAPPF